MKTKHKILIALSLLVVFGLGVTAGVLGERYYTHKNNRRPSGERSHAPSLESWAKELGLTEEQQATIREIFKKNEERMKAYRTETREKLGEIRHLLKNEIDAVLTPEQKKKNEEMIRRFEERRKNDPERNAQRDRGEPGQRPPDRDR
jgi:Spy/CpxP family protein refolding chaperone